MEFENIKKKLAAIKAGAMNLGCIGMNAQAIMEHMAQIAGIYDTANSILSDIEEWENGNGR